MTAPHDDGPVVGALYLLAEADYRFGLGALYLRAASLRAARRHPRG